MSDEYYSSGDGEPESFRYFFVFYHFAGIAKGNIVIKQQKPPENDGLDHGFNFISTTKFLIDRMKMPVVIESWQETTYKRYQDWLRLLSSPEMQALGVVAATKPDKFKVIQGEGQGAPHSPIAGLTVVPPEKPKHE